VRPAFITKENALKLIIKADARLILHSQSPSALLPLITQTGFSPFLSHVIAHPPALLAHLATEFLMPPPPISPLPKFWGVFLPLSERVHDTERLVFGSGGEGSGNPTEFVVELIVREGVGRNRGIERVLEGWSSALRGPCELNELEALKPFTEKKHGEVTTQILEFVPVLLPYHFISRPLLPHQILHTTCHST
jgi:elongator complex protein 5